MNLYEFFGILKGKECFGRKGREDLFDYLLRFIKIL